MTTPDQLRNQREELETPAGRAIIHTPKVHNSLHIADKEITFLRDRRSWETEWELEPNDKAGIGLILLAFPENSSP
jgi:hypothetical protein